MEIYQSGVQHEGEDSKKNDEGPQNVNVRHDAESKTGKRVLLKLLLILHVVLFLFLALFGDLFTIDR